MDPITDVNNVSEIEASIQKFVTMTYNNGTAKSWIEDFMEKIRGTEHEIELLEFSLSKMKPLLVQNEKEDSKIRLRLAGLLENKGKFYESAVVLKDACMLQKEYQGSESEELNSQKFELYIRIMRDFLEVGEADNAAAVISKAQYLRQGLTQIDPSLDIHFKLSQARVFDSSRKFLEASTKYYQASRESMVDYGDRLASLRQAIICAVLSPAGPQRNTMLRTLYNDERSQIVGEVVYSVLCQCYFDRLLSRKDIDALAAECSDHHLMPLSDGTTVLTRGLIDHNVLSLSRIYVNISLHDLAVLLDLESADRAEEYVSKMIVQNRLKAQIDDTNGFLYFHSNEESMHSGNADTHGLATFGNLIDEDRQWANLFADLNLIVSSIPAESIQSN